MEDTICVVGRKTMRKRAWNEICVRSRMNLTAFPTPIVEDFWPDFSVSCMDKLESYGKMDLIVEAKTKCDINSTDDN